jgi:hypothetical protein
MMKRVDEEGQTQGSSRGGAGPIERPGTQHGKQRANKENGRKGGLVKSRKKTAAARRNARRPRPGRRKKSSIF